jgi:hypothetical protein
MDKDIFRRRQPKTDWSDWLKDDPPPAAARQELRQKRMAEANRYQPRASQAPRPPTSPPSATQPSVTININLSKFKLPKRPSITIPKFKLPVLPLLRYKRLVLVIAGLALISLVGVLAWHSMHGSRQTGDTAAAVTYRTAPSFVPISPKDKPKLTDFPPNTTSYDGKRDTFSYVDLLPGGHITVSEQPLPSNISTPQAAVNKIAAQIKATQKLTVDNGEAFMGTDPKTGSQTLVFSLKGLLVFINSPYGHNAAIWQDYINNLQ